ncbi:MAG: CocE/NonD family hydrolase [Acidobacteriota bacterium]|nr:CocE/NonD family hydrolase [Acidobacteriota bacterium]
MKRFTCCFFIATIFLCGQGLEYIKANYTKYEFQIPMRDGIKLFASVYVPKDDSHTWPIMFDRTPYSVAPYGVDNYKTTLGPSELFAKDKFIFVYEDVRGKMMSEGQFVDMRPQRIKYNGPADIDESTDTYDSIEWLVKNLPNNNGKVGMWGISYPGFYTAAGVIHAHPALKCASPQAPIADWFIGDDFHHNGALYLPHAFRFFSSGFGKARPEPTAKSNTPDPSMIGSDGFRFYLNMATLPNANEKFLKNDVAFWNDLMKHGTYDEFWQARNLRPHLKDIKPAVMTVGGWFDAEDLFGALNVYKSIEQNSPGASNMLVMGPWFHGGWARSDGSTLGNVQFGSKTSEFYRKNIELPFFRHWLKGTADPKLPEAYVFETGTNQWRRLDSWPPKSMSKRSLYFHSNGTLSFEAPGTSNQAGEQDFDEYISDPAKPVPFIPGQAPGMTREHMTDDQRSASTRTDVLVYQTEPLMTDITVAGPVQPNLQVSTTGTDSDWIVKLIDVYPDDYPDPNPNPTGIRMAGYQQLIRGEVMRGKFRDSYEHPAPFVPGKVTKVAYTMPDIFHTFRKGHRIMVQVQSSWFPLVDRNPQKFMDIYNAKLTDFQKATQRVYHSRGAASFVAVDVL